MENTLDALQENLGYRFKNIRLLETALTHSSYANENGTVCNERLALGLHHFFLGV